MSFTALVLYAHVSPKQGSPKLDSPKVASPLRRREGSLSSSCSLYFSKHSLGCCWLSLPLGTLLAHDNLVHSPTPACSRLILSKCRIWHFPLLNIRRFLLHIFPVCQNNQESYLNNINHLDELSWICPIRSCGLYMSNQF